MKTRSMFRQALAATLLLLWQSSGCLALASEQWTEKAAAHWYQQTRWLVGSNYLPANASNQLEMWQAETFDPAQIDKEFGWAESIGMNTMRVFLHDLVWKSDQQGFLERIKKFLAIAEKHHIKPMFVFFDSCWDPNPKLGPQAAPTPGVHNSRWLQSPGAAALGDEKEYPRLEEYVKGVVTAFANDKRVLAWDVWNEPNSPNGAYANSDCPDKLKHVEVLLPKVFQWIRDCNPSQPLTSGVWDGDWSSIDKLTAIQKIQLLQSDFISFHNYGWSESFQKGVHDLSVFKRPVVCTEYMARSVGSTFDQILPLAKDLDVGAINWGFVAGKSQTYYPWDSWTLPYTNRGLNVWFHDIFNQDGSPYRKEEIDLIRRDTQEALTDARHKAQPDTAVGAGTADARWRVDR